MKLTVSKYPVKKSRGYDFRPRGFIFLLAAILTAGFVAVSNGQSDRRYRQYVRQLFVNRLSQSIENVFFGDNEKLINQRYYVRIMTTADNIKPQHQEIVSIKDDNQNIIEGRLSIPSSSTTANADIKGIVIFAHGSGSSRHSPRNMYVAQVLNLAGIATLLIDLLTSEEEKIDNITREHRFNIKLLAKRLLSATDWILQSAKYKSLKLGYFGASTGAAAALVAAAERSSRIYAIVSRGGRPDLAGTDVLSHIAAPTLLIVGENDKQVIELNEMALKQLTNIEKKKKMIIVPKATHLFEEPDALEEVAKRASGWFQCFFLEETHPI